jgi:Ca2+-binding EF-hand superfamily protein
VRAIVLHLLGLREDDLVAIEVDAKAPDPRCVCGSVFMNDSNFCRACGTERPPPEEDELDVDFEDPVNRTVSHQHLRSDDDLDLGGRLRGGDAADDAQLGEVWRAVDENGDGTLDREEVRLAMEEMGTALSDKKFEKAYAAMDRDGSGSIEFGEFRRWWQKQKARDQAKLVKRQAAAGLSADQSADLTALEGLDDLGALAALDVGAAAAPAALGGLDDFDDLEALAELDVEGGDAPPVLPARADEPAAEGEEKGEGKAKAGGAAGAKRLLTRVTGANEEQLEKQRQRRERQRAEGLLEVEQAHSEKQLQQSRDVLKLLDVVMDEVDEDGDEILNFHEFRKALLRSVNFTERFRFPPADVDNLLPYPNAEDDSSDDDTEILSDAEKAKMREFMTGHRRRKKSIEQQAEHAEAASRASKVVNPMHAADADAAAEPVGADGDGAATETIGQAKKKGKGKKMSRKMKAKLQRKNQLDAEDEQKRKDIWQQYHVKQVAARERESIAQLMHADRPDHLQETRNPERPRSVYSQLVIQRQRELQDMVKAERRKILKQQNKLDAKAAKADAKKAKRAPPAADGDGDAPDPGRLKAVAGGVWAANSLAHIGGVDWETMNVEDVESSLAFQSARDVLDQVKGALLTVAQFFNAIQNQDMIPIWHKQIARIEGHCPRPPGAVKRLSVP